MATALTVAAFSEAGGIRGTVSATTSIVNAQPAPLSGARLTLVNRDLPGLSLNTVTDEAGNFFFANLPFATYVLTVEADGFPTVTREVNLATGETLIVEVELTTALSETVIVREEVGLLSTTETTTSNVVHAETLRNVPLRAENYQSALLLTPGAVRDSDGRDHLKGGRAGQNAYTVNGADVTDPVTGNLAFDIPIEAAASVRIEENPYSAEFGRLTGGAINLETKGGGNKLKFTAARFFPIFRNVISGPIDSFRPRVTLTGPILRDRLFFLQSFEYRFSRLRVPGLDPPQDNSTSESFNSFTQFDLILNKNNRLKFVAAFFPHKARYVGLSTFNPRETRPNIKQRGSLFSVSEQTIFNDASFLSSNLSYKTFNVDIFGQGTQTLTLLPDLNTGNYFADTRRQAPRLQWQETYHAQSFELGGRHWFRIGTELDHTNVTGRFQNNPILIRRHDDTLTQRIEFTGLGVVTRKVNEFAAFVQDQWIVNPKLTVDVGLRFDRDEIARQNNFAPRLSFLFLPLKDDRTIIRGGVGLFYDRIPLAVGYFTQLPERVVTTFAPDGFNLIDGPRRFINTVDGSLYNPRSVRWSLQLDRGITKSLRARVGYLQRSTENDLIIKPLARESERSAHALSSNGRSRYRELQLLAAYNKTRMGDWTASYVWSGARGDLNTFDNFLGDFPAFVVRPNEYGPLPFDVPHRL
ncbi:MAG: TonB-dependent receptor, partial [Pyrinomonadaceae bacterium]|nr:TonB-dependent receptor [Pyrinomonadaceae bacterium]